MHVQDQIAGPSPCQCAPDRHDAATAGVEHPNQVLNDYARAYQLVWCAGSPPSAQRLWSDPIELRAAFAEPHFAFDKRPA